MKMLENKFKIGCKKYIKEVGRRKNILLISLLFCLIYMYTSPIKTFAFQMNTKVIAPYLYPYLLTDANFLILFMAGIVYYYSDILDMSKWNNYLILRTGRVGWLKRKLWYIVFSAIQISLIPIVLLEIAVFPYAGYEKGWGKALHTIAKTNAGKECGLFWEISLQYMSQNSPLKAMSITCILSSLVIIFIGLLMLNLELYFSKKVAIVSATIIILLVAVNANVGDYIKRDISMISPVSWAQIANIGITRYGYIIAPALIYILCGFSVLLILFIWILFYKVKRIDFS